ncbi:Hsp20/alpha crystallin family protein [Saccharicrinis aurantiacus]|uniref:Hsp20/alpha crystallin family protein n=1 Tax=Saccharicrinis aurantiacus TaxID=1849719 RepID=UPI00094FBA80|nr:Hsp20/alpha crystallin family protein [Saccharicrinis aurantiacus]
MFPKLKNATLHPGWTDDYFSGSLWADDKYSVGVYIPAVNVKEDENKFDIEVAAPGMEKKDFKIELNHNVLTISSENMNKKEDDTEKITRREFCYSSFTRSFTLPNSVKDDGIKASYVNGILDISIPKKEEAKDKGPKRIAIA